MSTEAPIDALKLTTTESKSARKKRAKAAEASKETSEPSVSTPLESTEDPMAQEATTNGYESSYVKELQKNIRNVSKKLNSMAKVDAIIAEHSDQSLEELVAARKINADQRAQALKKPALQASLTQLEEQVAQYKKIDSDHQTRLTSERDALTTSHKSEIEQLRESLKKEQQAESRTTLRAKLLVFSQFLRAAAAKRVVEEEADTDESRAFEGALLLVYGGDDKAVDAAENLIEGADEAVPSVDGVPLSVKYSQIKTASVDHAPYTAEENWNDTVADSAAAQAPADAGAEAEAEPVIEIPASDPTIAHAGLTELGAQPNGTATEQEADITSPVQASTGDAMSNLAGAATGGEESLDESFEMVPRDPTETETPHEPAMQNSTTSWADDAAAAAEPSVPVISQSSTPKPQSAAVNTASAPADDGFLEVERKRGGHRGGRGDGEGRGRGRGRGGYRGERGGDRGRGGFRGERRGGGEGRGRGGRGGQPRGAGANAGAGANSTTPTTAT